MASLTYEVELEFKVLSLVQTGSWVMVTYAVTHNGQQISAVAVFIRPELDPDDGLLVAA